MAADPAYRWNQSPAASAYDAAAPVIHPHYTRVQDALLDALPFAPRDAARVLDLGGGSGRLAERLLDRFPSAQVVVLDQSASFLGLAAGRLERFGARARLLQRAMHAEWARGLAPFDAVVSTSAIHHLSPGDKRALFKRTLRVLKPAGVFVNGDEHRPQSDAEFRRMLEEWDQHMTQALQRGEIPASFGPTLEAWRRRNLEGFGGPRQTGDDCQETVERQAEMLREAGFADVRVTWQDALWGVTVARG